MRSKLTGVGVALVTPFTPELTIDFPALKQLVENTIEGGVDYLVVNGTTAEASTLSPEEKKKVLNFVVEVNAERLPIVYGIGANNTQHVLDLIEETDFTHISAILTVSPYYNKPSQEGIYAHYCKVADASPVPVMLYNVPGRTGSNICSATTLRLAQHPNIFAIKEASGDLQQCMEIVREKPEDFMLISGDDLLTVPMISIGTEGVISVLANAYPKKFSSMIHDALEGNFAAASEHLKDFLPVNDYLYVESNPVGIKEVLRQMGVCGGDVRLPLLAASEELQQNIAETYPIANQKVIV